MNDYDSDSSGGEEAPYTETTTLLGYATKQPTGDYTKLGGLPSWIDGSTQPSGELARCKVCNGFTTLLLQVNGDMPEKFAGHERRLYIWMCQNKACRRKGGSVRSIRGSRVAKGAAKSQAQPKQSSTKPVEPAKPPVNLGATLFGTNGSTSSPPINPFSSNASVTKSNPFSSTPLSSTSTKPASHQTAAESLPETFASKARISPPTSVTNTTPQQAHEPWPSSDDLPAPYPELYLDAEYETLSAPATPQINKTISDVDMNGEGSSSGGRSAEDKDLFESTMDKTFQRFADRIAANPEQVIRYEFGGVPLLYSDNDTVGRLLVTDSSKKQVSKITVQSSTQGSMSRVPRCSNCGAERVFEVQLTPHTITELEADDMGVDGMEWGTIIVAVCSADCALAPTGEVGYVEEWTGVQYEELVSKKR